MKHRLHQFWLYVALLVVFITPIFAQVDDLKYAEKIYLQTDADVYTTGNKIWFRAVVLLGAAHYPSNVSGVLYVDLINPGGEVVVSQLTKLNEGIGAGTIHLNPDLAAGTYQLRAYTRWSQNFKSDFIFQKPIPVFQSGNLLSSRSYRSQITQDEVTGSRSLKTLLNPEALDRLHRGKLDVFVNLDGKLDTLSIRKKEGDLYVFEYPLAADSDLLTISYLTDTGKKRYQTVALDTAKIDLQFFPEGGDLIAGISSELGFKAIGYDGLSRKTSGTVIDQNGVKLADFKSNALGMGSFRLKALSDTLSYFAKLEQQDTSSLLIPLPKVKASGSTLSVNDLGGGMQVNVFSNTFTNDTLVLQVRSRGQLLYELKEPLRDGMLSALFPVSKLPFGILEISLLDKHSTKMARRLYFNRKGQKALKLAIETEKLRYAPREKLKLQLNVTDENDNPTPAKASVLIVDKNQLGKEAESRANILSYFFLESELRGTVEQPGFYFKNDTLQAKELDKLLLTQGWASYKYDTIHASRQFLPEPELLLSGTVSAPLNKHKRIAGVKLTLMSFDEGFFVREQLSDSLGRFGFTIDALSGGYQNLLIQTSKQSGKNKDYNLYLSRPKKPSIELRQQEQFALVDTTIVKAAEQKIAKQRVLLEAAPFGGEDIALDAVLVSSYTMTPQRQEVADVYGMPDVVIAGKAIQEKEKKWSYGLYSVLLFNFPDKINIVRKNGELRAEVNFSETTLVIVDGQPVTEWSYNLIPYMPVSEIESFEIIEYAKNFSSLYQEVHPFASPLEVPVWGHVIAIYTYGGNGLFAAERPKGIIKERVQVFSEPEAFYTPKYDTQQTLHTNNPDLRSTLYWEPNLEIDESGMAEVEFYNPDNTGTMLILVEAVSPQGTLGYKILDYQLEERDDP
ncbi:hypothetical protein ACFSYG_10060 [Leeuwenhoekiella polynyae]|uniref:MG2 domain-containing protein n=1 Tax=Leeuwenhoekiella polynyae TaxID=1550906 RepID=A0A4Q0PFJ3_9FLAO|nr:hypothetical protein [Leeuwenhoekiella polynyae]RXG25591.1 hypothetical protein DSM02_757 [Leeuwenhoekiella polynyae]